MVRSRAAEFGLSEGHPGGVAFFILWFFALTACGLNSQFGRTAADDESPRSLEEDF